MRCLVMGATGYVGSLLVPRLLAEGHEVRCLVRDPTKLARRVWAGQVESVSGDAADPNAVAAACGDVGAAFYLVHSMDGPGFADRDRAAATVFATAARAAGVGRIVYLGGLQPVDGAASAHLASRREVGDLLLDSGVPTAVLQAGIVVGAGSASFEMIRHLAAAAPVLPMPDRAWNAVQPIGVDDVLHHLAACLDLPADINGCFDIGGPEVLSYVGLVHEYAVVAGLPRPLALPVPGAAPRLTARAVAALTPVDRHLAGPLFESMAHDLVCRGAPPAGPPPGGPTSYAEAVRRAVTNEVAETRELVIEHVEHVPAPPAAVWSVVSGLGDTVPGVRALCRVFDGLLGGWRIEHAEPGRVLRLRAESRLPGTAHLELRVEPAGEGSRYRQRVTFRPDGPLGRAYWYAQLPAHRFVFAVAARTIAGVAARPPKNCLGSPCVAVRVAEPQALPRSGIASS